MAQKHLNILPKWPAQSSDLNPIEHLWDYMQKQIEKRNPHPVNNHELFLVLQEEWAKISKNIYKNLVNSVSRRVQECIEKEGGSINY